MNRASRLACILASVALVLVFLAYRLSFELVLPFQKPPANLGLNPVALPPSLSLELLKDLTDASAKTPSASRISKEFGSPTAILRPWTPSEPKQSSHSQISTSTKELLVEIVETNGWHDEVLAALVHSFGSQPNVQLGIFQKASRFGMPEIMNNFTLSHKLPRLQTIDEFIQSRTEPNIVVLTTCETDVLNGNSRLNTLLSRGKTFLYCIVHHADRWKLPILEQVLTPWIRLGLIDFVTLSPHTAAFLKQNGLRTWKVDVIRPIKSFAPVFPVHLPAWNVTSEVGGKDELAFAVQGNYEVSRRDYVRIFADLQGMIRTWQARDGNNTRSTITLHLIGSGTRPEVPVTLKDHVFFDENLSYQDFYNILARSSAILPAFTNNHYLDRKASSSVPASLIGSVPLVANQALLKSYAYLPKEAVYFQEEDQKDLDVISRVLNGTALDRRRKAMAVRDACTTLFEGNVIMFAGWIEEAEQILQRLRSI